MQRPYERALQIRTTTLGPEHQLVTNNLDRLATVYSLQEKLVEAEPLYKQSFVIREKETLSSLRSLAQLYVAREKFVDADPLYKLALAIFDKNAPQKKLSKKEQLNAPPPPPLLLETLDEYAAVLRKLRRKERHPNSSRAQNRFASEWRHSKQTSCRFKSPKAGVNDAGLFFARWMNLRQRITYIDAEITRLTAR